MDPGQRARLLAREVQSQAQADVVATLEGLGAPSSFDHVLSRAPGRHSLKGGVGVDQDDELLITITTSPASDSWGFVGVVSVGDQEAYRTIRAYTAPGEALGATQGLLADVLGTLMAGQEWSAAQAEFGHAPRRTELEFGLRAKNPRAGSAEPGFPAH